MKIEAAEQEAWRENLKKDAEKFCKELLAEINEDMPEGNKFKLEVEGPKDVVSGEIAAFALHLYGKGLNGYVGKSKDDIKEIGIYLSPYINTGSGLFVEFNIYGKKKAYSPLSYSYRISEGQSYTKGDWNKAKERIGNSIKAALGAVFKQ